MAGASFWPTEGRFLGLEPHEHREFACHKNRVNLAMLFFPLSVLMGSWLAQFVLETSQWRWSSANVVHVIAYGLFVVNVLAIWTICVRIIARQSEGPKQSRLLWYFVVMPSVFNQVIFRVLGFPLHMDSAINVVVLMMVDIGSVVMFQFIAFGNRSAQMVLLFEVPTIVSIFVNLCNQEAAGYMKEATSWLRPVEMFFTYSAIWTSFFVIAGLAWWHHQRTRRTSEPSGVVMVRPQESDLVVDDEVDEADEAGAEPPVPSAALWSQLRADMSLANYDGADAGSPAMSFAPSVPSWNGYDDTASSGTQTSAPSTSEGTGGIATALSSNGTSMEPVVE